MFNIHNVQVHTSTPLGKTCPKEFPMSSDWDDDKEEEDQVKGENKDSEKKTPQTIQRFFAATTLTLQPPKPSITKHFGKRSSAIPEKEECRCYTIAMLLGHEDQNQDTLEDIN